MSALADTEARIASIGKLRTVVGAMRSMAASHSQQARAALPAYREYAQVVSGGLGQAAMFLGGGGAPAPLRKPAGRALVVFCAEHGFAGAFAARLLDAAKPKTDQSVFVLGSRGVALAERRGWRPAWTAPMASQVSGAPAAARRVADGLYQRFAEDGLDRVEVVYARLSGSSDFTIERRQILPMDPNVWRQSQGQPPHANLPAAALLERLIGEYVFAELALAALESFASENAARLAIMESARVNIDGKLDSLSAEQHLQRQEEITAEIQDITAGALASGSR